MSSSGQVWVVRGRPDARACRRGALHLAAPPSSTVAGGHAAAGGAGSTGLRRNPARTARDRDAAVPNILYVAFLVNRTEDGRTEAGRTEAGKTEAGRTEAGKDGGPASGASGRRAAHVRDTRRALLDTARRLFTRDGFQGTRTEEVAEQAGLTRGALYHHFRDKEDLFRAVHEEVVAEVAPLLWRRSSDPSTSAWTLFRANSEIYLEAACSDESYRQIVLIDGPAVLGWQYLSERGNGPTDKIAEYLRDAVDEGVLRPQPIDPLAHLLSALGTESAMYVAHAEDPEEARRQINECYERLLAGLVVPDASATAADSAEREAVAH